MPIHISTRSIMRVLVGVAVLLVSAHVTVQTVRFLAGDHSLFGLVFFLSLGAETNLPAYYASVILMVAGTLSAVAAPLAADEGRVMALYWVGLAALFAFLAMDEMLSIHERLIDPVRSLLGTSGLFYYAWVIPYGVGTLIFAAVYSRFLYRLPRQTAKLLILAGATYVTGALVLEMLGGWYSQHSGNATVGYVVLQTVEEVLELAGVLLFINAILDHLTRKAGGVLLQVGADRADRGVSPPSTEAPGRMNRAPTRWPEGENSRLRTAHGTDAP